GGAVELRGVLHANGLVRALVVVFLHEVVEPRLLLQAVLAGGARGFLLQRQMPALVAAVLLRVPGFDALDADPEPQPPNRKFAQPEEGAAAGEGDAIVGTDRQREAKVLENPL